MVEGSLSSQIVIGLAALIAALGLTVLVRLAGNALFPVRLLVAHDRMFATRGSPWHDERDRKALERTLDAAPREVVEHIHRELLERRRRPSTLADLEKKAAQEHGTRRMRINGAEDVPPDELAE